MKKRLVVKLIIAMLSLASILCFAIGCGGVPHTHVFDQQVVNDTFKASDATCEDKATYYLSCTCGAKGTETFENGEALGHSFTNYVYNDDAECEKDGTETAICDNGCGEDDTRTKTGSALEHEYGAWVSNNDGTHTKTCANDTNHTVTEDCSSVDYKCDICGGMIYTEGLVFTLSADGKEYSVTGYTGSSTDVIIPNNYLGIPVTSICDNAFLNCDLLTSVKIGNNVISIGNNAFRHCDLLSSVEIGNNVTTIGYAAFISCISLTSVVMPNSVTSIESDAFNNCTSLTIIDIPNSVTNIGASAFYKCTSLEIISIPDSVTSIGNAAFFSCTKLQYNIENELKYLGNNTNKYLYLVGPTANNLTTATINNNCKIIGSTAFASCTSLKSISIPDSVISINSSVFNGCSNLTSVVIGNGLTRIGGSAFANCTSLESIEIPDSVITIVEGAFSGCSKLTSIIIGNGVTAIGSQAFLNCSSLSNITIPSSVTFIDVKVFYGCTSLTNIIVSKDNQNYKSIDGNLYTKDEKTLLQYATGKTTTSFTIPNSVTTITEYAFAGSTSLVSIVIPSNVINIGEDALRDCKKLTTVVIENGAMSIGVRAFYNCSALTDITIPDSVTSIGYYAFMGCSKLKYNIEGNLKYLGNDTNKYLYLVATTSTTLKTVTINANCKFIGSRAFYKCTLLTSIEIPNSVTSIEYNAFYGCSKLTSVTIPNSVTSIGSSAFADCTSLTNIVIPNSVTSIGEYAFSSCRSLTSIKFNGTKAEWNAIEKGDWNSNVPATEVVCTDGVVAIS